MQITDEVIAKLNEIAAAVDPDGVTRSLNFSVNRDDSGTSYDISTQDPTGRVRRAGDRIPNPPAA